MKFLVTDRGRGKTTRLIEWVKAAPEGETRVILSHSLRETNRLQRENPELASWQFVGLDDVLERQALAGRRNVVIGIDNLDLILGTLLRTHFPVGLVTATGENAAQNALFAADGTHRTTEGKE